MDESKSDKSPNAEPASAPDELVKDLDVKLSEAEQSQVTGGKKQSQEYMQITMKEAIITS